MAINDLDLHTFEQFINKFESLVVVLFSASWCAPCAALKPAYSQLARAYADQASFGVIDVGQSPSIIQNLGVHGVPALGYFYSGQMISLQLGNNSFGQLQASLERELRKIE